MENPPLSSNFSHARASLSKNIIPLVPFVVRIESIREKVPTLYLQVDDDDDASSHFRKSVRRHYRRMQNLYQRHGIRHESVSAERCLNLSQIVPILWEHQERICEQEGKNALEEFIKRALVVTVVPDGILDLYRDPSGDLCSFQFSILTGSVLHWFMYFCKGSASRTGIWWHGALLAIQRGRICPTIQYVNAQVHQTESKLHAGFVKGFSSEISVMEQIYPWAFTRKIPDQVRSLRLWDDAT